MQKKSEAFPKKIYLKPALEERLAQILAVPLTVAVPLSVMVKRLL